MNSRPRQFLIVLFLLAFSLENFAAAAFSSEPGQYNTFYKIQVQKENLTVTDFLSEANEELDDDKVHGLVWPEEFVPYSESLFVSKIKQDFQRSLHSMRHQQILCLICRLSI